MGLVLIVLFIISLIGVAALAMASTARGAWNPLRALEHEQSTRTWRADLQHRLLQLGWSTIDTPANTPTSASALRLRRIMDDVTVQGTLGGMEAPHDAPDGMYPTLLVLELASPTRDLSLALETRHGISIAPAHLVLPPPCADPHVRKGWLALHLSERAAPHAVCAALPGGEALADLLERSQHPLFRVELGEDIVRLYLALAQHERSPRAFNERLHEEAFALLQRAPETIRAARALIEESASAHPERLAEALVRQQKLLGDERRIAGEQLAQHAPTSREVALLRGMLSHPLEHPDEALIWSTVEPDRAGSLDARTLQTLCRMFHLSRAATTALARRVMDTIDHDDPPSAPSPLHDEATTRATWHELFSLAREEQPEALARVIDALVARAARHATTERSPADAVLLERLAHAAVYLPRGAWDAHRGALASTIIQATDADNLHRTHVAIATSLALTPCVGALNRWLQRTSARTQHALRDAAERFITQHIDSVRQLEQGGGLSLASAAGGELTITHDAAGGLTPAQE